MAIIETNAFTQASKIEKIAADHLLPWLRQKSEQVEENKGEFLQKQFGDWVQLTSDGIWRTIELKAEESNKYGNFFLESWSNREPPYWTRGWMDTCRADYLFYYFVEQRELYVFDFNKLKQWAFGDRNQNPNIYKYPEKPQDKYTQLNATFGWCVPIRTLMAFKWCAGWRSTGMFEYERMSKEALGIRVIQEQEVAA